MFGRRRGVGIASHRLKAIFQPFTQAENDTSRHFGGSGLGLTISRRITDLLEGKLSATSQLDKGSTFTLDIQLTPTEAPKKTVDTHSPNPTVATELKGKILLIEDNPTNIKIASAMLKRLGFEVEHALDGEQAIQLCRAKKYDCILMDIQMPGMDGFECTQIIRADGVRTPIIALTANSSEDIRSQAIAVGMDDFISKPFQMVHLGQRINRLL